MIENNSPTIRLYLNEPTLFLLDSGAGANIIKQKVISEDLEVEKNEILYLTGITTEVVKTLGRINLFVLDYETDFHVVPNDFPIREDGIIGANFLAKNKAKLNWERNRLELNNGYIPFFEEREIYTIPPRCRQIISVEIRDTDLKTGYIPHLNITDGVYMGNAVVKNENGKAFMPVINTSEEEVDLYIPQLTLYEIERIQGTIDNIDANSTTKRTTKRRERTKLKLQKRQILNFHEEERYQKITELLQLDHLDQNELKEMELLIKGSLDRFHIPGDELTCTNVLEHEIRTVDENPIHTKQYRFPPALREEITKQVDEMLENRIIQPSQSPYNTPIWIVPKREDSKGNKRWRLVLDFRNLNEKTVGNAYPLPNIVEILDQLGDAKYFSTFDLASGFHQIKMSEKDRHKTAFSTPHGHYEFLRMPFGLKNAPATFQHLMDIVLTGLQGIELFVYLDDIVIYAKTLSEHRKKYMNLVDRLRQANLKLQPDKCHFLRREVTYLGHQITEEGLKPDEKKIEAVKHFPTPRSAKNIKQFLGLAGYYRRFIHQFSKISKPLTKLLQKGIPFIWEEEQEKAFQLLKAKLCGEPVLKYPDFTKPFVLTTDASGYAIAGILSQGPIGKDQPCAYVSRLLNVTEQKYSTYEKEALAILYSVSHFRPYLYGRKFTIVTDHLPLVWMRTAKDPTSRLARWRLKLEEYDFDVLYKAGKTNVNADALSRNVPGMEKEGRECEDPESENHNEQVAKVYPYDTGLRRSERTPKLTEKGQQYRDEIDKKLKGTELREHTQSTEQNRQEETDFDDNPNELSETQNPKRIPPDKAISQTDLDEDLEGIMEYDSDVSEKSEESNDDEDSSENHLESDDDPCDDDSSDNDSECGEEPESLEKIIYNKNIFESRDQLLFRKDNYAFFLNESGKPFDLGTIKLSKNLDINCFPSMTLGSSIIVKRSNKYHIGLCVSPTKHIPTIKESTKYLKDSLKDLFTKIPPDKIQTFSIQKVTNIDQIKWSNIVNEIKKVFQNSPIKITLCLALVVKPLVSERATLIEEAHTSAVGGHKGVTKTYHRLRNNYYWEYMKDDVQNYIQHCLSCKLKKLTRVKIRQPMTLTDTPGCAFEKIALDIVGPFPITKGKGNRYILTMQCLLTKHCTGVVIPNATASTIADAFLKHFICIYGTPKIVLTDQGTNFVSKLMKALTKRLNIRRLQTTAFHPQTNGSLERTHIVLTEYLRQFISADSEWDDWVELAMFSYNTSIHESTNRTPYELVFGKAPNIPSSHPLPKGEQLETYDDYLVKLMVRLDDLQNEARRNLEIAKTRSKHYYDKKQNAVELEAGNYVFLRRGLKNGKLGLINEGPYRIIEVLNDKNVKLQIGKKEKVVSTDRLIPTQIDL